MIRTVLLDLFGVLIDERTTSRLFHEELAGLFSEEFGGQQEEWVPLCEEAHALWEAEWREGFRRAKEGGDGSCRGFYDSLEVRWFRELLSMRGYEAPAEDSDALSMARDMERRALKGFDGSHPWSKQVVEALEEEGYALYLCTAADDVWTDTTLRSAGLASFFEEVLNAYRLDHWKGTEAYWREVTRRVEGPPSSGVVVDDTPLYLRSAGEVGFRSVLVDGGVESDFEPDVRVDSLREVPEAVTGL